MTPTHPTRWTVVAASMLLVAAACGDSGGDSGGGASSPSPSSPGTTSASAAALAWADGFCSSVSDWQGTVDKVRSDLAKPQDLNGTQLQNDVSEVVDSTQAMMTAMKDVPDVAGGITSTVQQQLDDLSNQLQQQSDVIEGAVAAKPATLQDLAQEVTTVAGAVRTMSADVRDTVTGLQDSLEGADPTHPFQTAPACRALNRS